MKKYILLLLLLPAISSAHEFQFSGYDIYCNGSLIDPELTECREYLATLQIGQQITIDSATIYTVMDNSNALSGGTITLDLEVGSEISSFSGFFTSILSTFSSTTTTTLLLSTLVVYGLAVLSIIGAVVIVALGYLVYKYGKRAFWDNSIILGGYYLRSTPIQGYNRWRSQKWNMKHRPWEKKT